MSLGSLPGDAYAYLLGLYLGDGHIARWGSSIELRIYCDARYGGVTRAAIDAIGAVHPDGSVRVHDRRNARCLVVVSAWGSWPVLFPQHGPGRKHERSIQLVDWQRTITGAHPEALVRGLLHSDGCRFVARQASKGRVYEYTRYQFSNRSEDIKAIFCQHLDLLGVRWTRASEKVIAVDRRPEVAKLEAFVGPKS